MFQQYELKPVEFWVYDGTVEAQEFLMSAAPQGHVNVVNDGQVFFRGHLVEKWQAFRKDPFWGGVHLVEPGEFHRYRLVG